MNIQTQITETQMAKPAVSAFVDHVIVTLQDSEWGIVHIAFCDEDGKIVARKQASITLEESELWVGDDSYVLTLALQKLEISFAA